MAKKTGDTKKKKIIQIVLLLSVLGAFAFLLIFVTLPALGIELFCGRETTQAPSRKTPATVSTAAQPGPTTQAKEPTVDERYLSKVIEELSQEQEVTKNYESEAFRPYIFNFEDEEQVKDILINSTNIMEFRDGTFMSYFLT